MTTLTGEVLPYFDAIGTADGSEAMLAAMKLVGTTFTLDEYTSMGTHEKYLIFAKGGVEMLVLDGLLDTIFFRLVAGPTIAAYRDPDALIPGVHHGMSRDAVIDLLGDPLRNEPTYLLYTVGTKFLNVRMSGEVVDDFSLQRHDLVAELKAEFGTPAPAEQITGEIALLIGLAGTPYGDEALTDLVAILGPRLDSHDNDDESGTGRFLVFPDSGVDVQYRGDVLIGALIHTVNDERSPYPRLDALVEGLTFPASRTDVVDALGTPQNSLRDMDVYTEKSRFVMFNYTNDALTTISIAHVPGDH